MKTYLEELEWFPGRAWMVGEYETKGSGGTVRARVEISYELRHNPDAQKIAERMLSDKIGTFLFERTIRE